MTINWFLSGTVRHATAMRKHVQKLLNHQRDILAPQALTAVQNGIADLQKAIEANPEREVLEKEMEKLEGTANKWLKPYPNAVWRENVEVLLVALAVAMGIRTFFLQPFKIPTGSMQPTLYGVTSSNLKADPSFKIPTGLQRVREWFQGISYIQFTSDDDGQIFIEPPKRLLIFNIKQTIHIGGSSSTIWFPPDYGSETLEQRAGLLPGQFAHRGEELIRLKVQAGDHLFVDRVSYNFRPPQRGEIIVFETKGIPEERRETGYWHIPPDQFYIKRLVGLGGENVKIGTDHHLIINGQRLDSSTPHFEKIYSFDPKEPPRPDHYSGHTDGGKPFFSGKPNGVDIPKGSYLVMGDNTENSLDSRYWGDFPSKYVIGKSFFVYWPLTERFGWGYHR